MRLFHFSEDGEIDLFTPRSVTTPSPRPTGREWLNGPLVWAIEEPRQALYLFPRDCPRIVLWPKPSTSSADRARWIGPGWRMAAYVEAGWLERLRAAQLWRYELPPETFEELHDAGMWISRQMVRPLRRERLTDLPCLLRSEGVDLRPVERLTPLRPVWSTTLHASGVRLRNAIGWT